MNKLINLSSQPQLFWSILPDDWSEDISGIWHKYNKSSEIHGILHHNVLVGGGIIFNEVSPDMEYARDEANKWFKNGYRYIGFLWIHPEFRGKQLGIFWLNEVYKLNSGQKYWLTIEDHNLMHFYSKTGFRFEKKLYNNGTEEWLLVKD